MFVSSQKFRDAYVKDVLARNKVMKESSEFPGLGLMDATPTTNRHNDVLDAYKTTILGDVNPSAGSNLPSLGMNADMDNKGSETKEIPVATLEDYKALVDTLKAALKVDKEDKDVTVETLTKAFSDKLGEFNTKFGIKSEDESEDKDEDKKDEDKKDEDKKDEDKKDEDKKDEDKKDEDKKDDDKENV